MVSLIAVMNGWSILLMSSTNGGVSTSLPYARCFAQTSLRILPIGSVLWCRWPSTSVMASRNSCESLRQLQYQTKFSRRSLGSRLPLSPGMVYLLELLAVIRSPRVEEEHSQDYVTSVHYEEGGLLIECFPGLFRYIILSDRAPPRDISGIGTL